MFRKLIIAAPFACAYVAIGAALGFLWSEADDPYKLVAISATSLFYVVGPLALYLSLKSERTGA